MKYELEIADSARLAMDDIYRFHEDRKPGEGTDILSLIWDRIDFIEQYPKRYQIRFEDKRTAPVRLKSFQYLIIYQIVSPKVVVIDFVSQSSDWLPFST